MSLYNWYYFNEDEYDFAVETIKFLEEKLEKVEDENKVKRIKLSITALKYYYSI